MNVPSIDPSPDEDFENESSRLESGLQSCRTVLSSYRALIESGSGPAVSELDEESSASE